MKVQDLNSVNPPKRPDKQSSVEDIKHERKLKSKNSDTSTNQASSIGKSDQVEISPEAIERQKSKDEFGASKELLSQLPSSRANVIYEALAKIKAGLYSSDEVVEEAASRLLSGGELDNII